MINSDHLPFWKLLKSPTFPHGLQQLWHQSVQLTVKHSFLFPAHFTCCSTLLQPVASKKCCAALKILNSMRPCSRCALVLVAMSRGVVSTERDPAIALRPCVAPLPLIVYGDDGEGSPSRTALTWIAQHTPVTKGYCTAAVLHSDQCNC